jgi:hypothetical protein
MKNNDLKPDDYRWVKVETGEELLMTGKELEMRLRNSRPDLAVHTRDPEQGDDRSGKPSVLPKK